MDNSTKKKAESFEVARCMGEVFADGKEHRAADIHQAVEHKGIAASKGQVTRLLFRWTQSGKLRKTERGFYQLNNMEAGKETNLETNEENDGKVKNDLFRDKGTKGEGMQGKLLKLISRHRRGLTESLRGINVLDVDGETFGLIGDMKRVLALMQEIEMKYDKEPHEK